MFTSFEDTKESLNSLILSMEKEGVFCETRLSKYYTALLSIDTFHQCTTKIRKSYFEKSEQGGPSIAQ